MKFQLEEIKKIKVEEKVEELVKENSILAKKIEDAKNELISLEVSNGKKQYSVPGKQANVTNIVSDTLSVKLEETKKDAIVENVQPIKEKKEKSSSKKIKDKVATTQNNKIQQTFENQI